VNYDVVVVGAGIVGASCAYYAARDGLSVCVVDRGPLAGGTTSAGEGNLLVSDKEPGPELELALLANAAWRDLAEVEVGVRTTKRAIGAAAVVNAAGTWAGEVAALAGTPVPVAPRRGFILVTEPLPRLIRRKVYFADYVADVASDSPALQTSPVVEGTPAGNVLIGATRERVGFDRSWSDDAVRALARGAVRLFPFLADVAALRAYRGFRPYCPDHLPVIGADPRAPGLVHACGHEGAGIGLSTATGLLVSQVLRGAATDMSLEAFRPDRFEDVAA
jgi:glycine/D-amino acid oxidase-like deaminating enzyme